MSTNTQVKDYYEILGVKRTASLEEIKAAYRKLAKEHHPDMTGGDSDSEKKFKEVAEAYETLSSLQKKSSYDNSRAFGGGLNSVFGDMFGFMFNQATPRTNRQPRDIFIRVSITMKEAYSGCSKTIQFERTRYCNNCKGAGMVPTASTENKCSSCNGTGYRYGVAMVPCQACGGTGKSGMAICEKCNWHGFTKELATISLKIPPRTNRGSVFRAQGEGHIDASGQGGMVDIEVAYPSKEEGFYLDPTGNISCTMVADWSSILAEEQGEISILGVEDVKFKFDGTKRDDFIYTFKGMGMGTGRKGDLLVKVVYMLPENMVEEDRKAIAAILNKYDNPKTGS